MSQGAIVVANGSGASVRAAINAALARLQTRGSGTARPADIAAGEYWFETDNPGSGTWSLWLWDGTNDILIGLLDTGAHTFRVPAAALAGILTTQGDILIRGASAPERLAAASDALSALFSGGAGANPAWAHTWKELGTANPNAASSVDFTGIPSSINHLLLLGQTRVNTTGANVLLRTYDASGSLDSGASDYFWTFNTSNTSSTAGVSGDGSDSAIALNSNASNDAGWSPAFTVHARNIQSARYTIFDLNCHSLDNGGAAGRTFVGAGGRAESDRITGLSIFPSSGTLGGALDKITLFGAN